MIDSGRYTSGIRYIYNVIKCNNSIEIKLTIFWKTKSGKGITCVGFVLSLILCVYTYKGLPMIQLFMKVQMKWL